MKVAFWGTNIGLTIMFLLTLFPVGILQLQASFNKGLWYARSPEFYNQSIIKLFGNIRIAPDTIIIVLGVLPLLWFMLTTIGKLRPVQVREEESLVISGDDKGVKM